MDPVKSVGIPLHDTRDRSRGRFAIVGDCGGLRVQDCQFGHHLLGNEGACWLLSNMSRVRLHIIAAYDLPSVSTFSSQQPYVVCKALPGGTRTAQTEIDDGNGNNACSCGRCLYDYTAYTYDYRCGCDDDDDYERDDDSGRR